MKTAIQKPKYTLGRVREFRRKYRGEIVIAVVSGVAGVVLGKLADIVFAAATLDQISVALQTAIAAFLFGLSLTIKKNLTWRVAYLDDRLSELVGHPPTQYDERRLHFRVEKDRLAHYLARVAVPEVAQKRLRHSRPSASFPLAIVIDSGTTLEPFFPLIKMLALGHAPSDFDPKRIEIYTNSLSGSDAFSRAPAGSLNEDQLNLFGGTQVEKYRAVTGEETLRSIDALKERYAKSGGTIVGLITANWFLVGTAYNRLVLCSSEIGHLAFKQRLVEVVDELIVVSPLGKLLKIDDPGELNKILKLGQDGKPAYRGFSIDSHSSRNRENTYLLTTYRFSRTAILHPHSVSLVEEYEQNKHSLYTLYKPGKPLALDHRVSADLQRSIEMPHDYLRDHAFKVLQIHE